MCRFQEIFVLSYKRSPRCRPFQAAAVVGSHSSGFARPHSDVDLFVYVDDTDSDEVLQARRGLADALADPGFACVVQQTGHPYADVWVLPGTETYLDLMFWTQHWAEDELDWRLVRHQRQVGGASTAFWRSIRDGVPIFDRSGWLAELQQRARAAYPSELRKNILAYDLDLLGASNPFAFRNQVEKVVREGDGIAAQHLGAKFLEAYFDALFAANRVLHPGEKRLVAFASRECAALPVRLRDDVATFLTAAAELSASIGEHMDRMVADLTDVIARTVDSSAD